ncbi:kallikrein-5 [Delphinapterus leucas]|uniref:Kallikrein-5 n=1 Tax=Delphinapterus leucas TaxID=9749 RepID=A0A7F8K9K6_DELLE|nr:kallikrein-5 [Delphinapterus leucas]
MRPRVQWVVITQAGRRERRRRRLQDSGGGAGSGFPTPYLGDVAAPPPSPSPAPELYFRQPPHPYFLPPEPVLASDVASCDNSSAVGPSGSTQDLGPGAGENSRASDGTSSRLVNGTDCERPSQPWQGALLLGPNKLYCGAVLVDSQWLLTAAHCRKQVFRIRLGHHSLSPIYESRQQLFQGIKSIPHPGSSHPGHSNDLTLIKLNERICEAQHVGPSTPPIVHPLGPAAWRLSGKRPAVPRGDSGGPVVCSGSLQGLVSWGDFPCAQPNRPGVCTNLCWFSKWIQDTIQSNA